jgi:glyoxylase-like metal-dependent hydrolase (beta-lactamase superfamily II)
MVHTSVRSLGHDLYLIDAWMHDDAERLACYLFDTPERVLIECGPSRSLPHLLNALHDLGIDDVGTLAVTHIHLDHAGGAGHFAARFPNARVAVHAAGVPHLIDPTRLWASAARIYGDEGMLDLWGQMEPIDPDRILTLDEGHRLPLGPGRSIEVMATPGHARHHVVYLEDETGAAFVGDAVGIAFPHGHMVQPVTPPPDFDPDLVVAQLHRIAKRHPAFLAFAHFGPDRDPQRSLADAESRLREWVTWVEEATRSEPKDLTDAMRTWVLDGYRRRGLDEPTIETYDKNTFWPMQASGILRWLSRR